MRNSIMQWICAKKRVGYCRTTITTTSAMCICVLLLSYAICSVGASAGLHGGKPEIGEDDIDLDYQQDDATKPSFLSDDGTHTVRERGDITLPCVVEKLGDYTVFWKKLPNELLTSGDERMTDDDRFQAELNEADKTTYNLRISNVEGFDSGRYACVISTQPEVFQEQVLTVQVAPSISVSPDEQPYIVAPGKPAIMVCNTKGNPVPTVTWRKQGGLLPNGHSTHIGNAFSIANVQPDAAGTYECTASNGVGADAKDTVYLQIQSDDNTNYGPWVIAGDKYLPVRVGEKATLTCKFGAKPDPTVTWTAHGYHVNHHKHGARYVVQPTINAEGPDARQTSLVINGVTEDDFGDYKCTIANQLGNEERTIHVSARPGPVEITDSEKTSATDLPLSWSVHSAFPILQYMIQFKKHGSAILDTTTIIDAPKTSGHTRRDKYEMSYVIRDLEPGSKYEIRVRAKNEHGWSAEPPRPHIAETQGRHGAGAPRPKEAQGQSPGDKKTSGSSSLQRPTPSSVLSIACLTTLTLMTTALLSHLSRSHLSLN